MQHILKSIDIRQLMMQA